MLKNTLNEVETKNTKIEIFGLGYVGFPLAVRLSKEGWSVTGIDIDKKRLERLKKDNLAESELKLQSDFIESKKNKTLSFSDKPLAYDGSKIGIICVPTPIPSAETKSDFFVNSAVEKFLETSKQGDIIIIESSIELGTTDKIKQLIESNGYKVGENFGLAFCPERIDPLNKKWNLDNIPRVIYCSDDSTFAIMQRVYHDVNSSNLIRVSSAKVAEVIKSFENTFRLVNISLVNEMAILCDHLEIDFNEVMTAASSKPFGFMPFYSGAGAGGHCIPKDPKFLLESSKKFGIDFKSIENALHINSLIPKYIVDIIEKILSEKNLAKSVIICGMSYKPNSEDMRDSPSFKILDEFQKQGYDIAIYDPFFKNELLEKYLIENHLKEKKFTILKDLDDDNLSKYACICVVQHHTKSQYRLEEIYRKSKVPVIYDCQNKLKKISSSTLLVSLGNKNIV
ncbi:MAG: nucleotide sugar dehydrogenase [Nitrosopumilus sp.]|nr:nucleotide sugar dehydrogenase [Nitrosopumilus sp.]MDH3385830.1 nucleotide sugar dehydrogenase [Nitrosopumilus sp.]